MAHDTQYPELLNEFGWSLYALATVVVGARCYCRAVIAHNFTLDDCFMVMALISGLVMMILVSIGVRHGYGLHLQDIRNPHDREQALMYTYVAPTISILASTLGKISMVVFLVHLLGQSTRRVHLWLLYSVTGITIVANILTVGVLLGGCVPIRKSWNPSIHGSCIDPNVFDYVGRTQSGWNAFMDLITAAFPAYMIWRLQLKRSTKWSLTSLMCGGLLAASATFAKIWYMRDISKVTDITYAWAPISVCYIAEVFILIIAGSLPTLRPVVRICCGSISSENRVFAAFKKSDSSATTTTGRYGGTTMAGTNGWELPEIEDRENITDQDGHTALPPYPSRLEERASSDQPAMAAGSSQNPARYSFGIITVQQEFDLTEERVPKDSMSLESVER